MQPRPRKKYRYKGKILYTCDILRLSGVTANAYKMRVRRGWPLVLAMTTPTSRDVPREVDPDLVFEVESIIEGEFRLKAQEVLPPDDSRLQVYMGIVRSGKPLTKRWRGERGFQRFVADMGERPANTVFSVRDKKRMLSRKNCYWGKE